MYFFSSFCNRTFVSSKNISMKKNITLNCDMKRFNPLSAKLCAALMSCLFFANMLKAQYVTIPDTAFVSWLQNNGFAGCMSGNQLDTTCNAVLNATGLYLYGAGMTDLTGIVYFKNLDSLDCEMDNISTMPQLPSTLVYLNCANNSLTSLPTLS